MAREVHLNNVRGRRCTRLAHRMEFNPKLRAVHDDSQVAVVRLVVLIDGEPGGLHHGIDVKIVDLGSRRRRRRCFTSARIDDRFDVEAAIACNNEGDAVVLSCEAEFAGVALIVVGVTGKKRVGIYALRLANCINLSQHQSIADVTTAAGTRTRGITERRVMHGDQHRSGEILRFDVL